MARSSDENFIIYFPWGGDEYKACKIDMPLDERFRVSQTISKVGASLRSPDIPLDLIIVGHGSAVNEDHKIYKNDSSCFNRKKLINEITIMLTKLGDQFTPERVN